MANKEPDNTVKIFRYKLDDGLTNCMKKFTKVHENDDYSTFKESWEQWIKDNNDIIQRENARLTNIGYTGNIHDKIHRSIRYYYSKKSNRKANPKKRRKYISLDTHLLQKIDNYINKGMKQETFKPSLEFDIFLKNNSKWVKVELKRILDLNVLSKEKIYQKIKKTFNNRYSIYRKNCLNKI